MKFVFGCLFGVAILTPFTARAVFASESSAESSEVTAALARVQEISLRRKSFSVSYEQTRFKALVKKTIVEKGSLDFVAPKSFRWEILTPAKEIYVSNGKDFWKYSEVARHAQKLKADTGELAILDVLFKPGNLKQDYRVEAWTPKNAGTGNGSDAVSTMPPPEKAGKLFVALFPRVKSKQKAMYLVVDAANGFVDELRIVHENGNRVRTVFGAPSEKSVPASRFEFVPPPGTAIDQ